MNQQISKYQNTDLAVCAKLIFVGRIVTYNYHISCQLGDLWRGVSSIRPETGREWVKNASNWSSYSSDYVQ